MDGIFVFFPVIFIISRARIITCGALYKFTRRRCNQVNAHYHSDFSAALMGTPIGSLSIFCPASFDLDDSIGITRGAFACYYLLVPEYSIETIFSVR